MFKGNMRRLLKKAGKPIYKLLRPLFRKIADDNNVRPIMEALHPFLISSQKTYEKISGLEKSLTSNFSSFTNLNFSVIDQIKLAYIKQVQLKEKNNDSYTQFLSKRGITNTPECSLNQRLNDSFATHGFILRHTNPNIAKTLILDRKGGCDLALYLASSTKNHIDIFRVNSSLSINHPQINELLETPLDDMLKKNQYHTLIYQSSQNSDLKELVHIVECCKNNLIPEAKFIFVMKIDGEYYVSKLKKQIMELIFAFTSRFKTSEFSTAIYDSKALRWEFQHLGLTLPINTIEDQAIIMFAGTI